MTSRTYTVPNISCNHCKMTVEQTLDSLPGVTDVTVDVGAKKVSLRYDEAQITEDRILDALGREGYPAQEAHGT